MWVPTPYFQHPHAGQIPPRRAHASPGRHVVGNTLGGHVLTVRLLHRPLTPPGFQDYDPSVQQGWMSSLAGRGTRDFPWDIPWRILAFAAMSMVPQGKSGMTKRARRHPMAHEMAIATVNTIKMQLAQVVRAMIQALQDGKVTPAEGMQLSMQGMTMASSMLTVVQGVDAATRQDILFVLEHGQIVVQEP